MLRMPAFGGCRPDCVKRRWVCQRASTCAKTQPHTTRSRLSLPPSPTGPCQRAEPRPGRAERKRGAEKVALPRARSARAGYAAKTPSSSHGRARRPEGDEASTAEAAGVGAREGWVSG